MRISPEFPDDRRRDPMRRAELRVYRRLAASEVAGRALYQVRASKRDRELDFLVFLEGLARIGIEVKGGSYRLRGGGWQLRTTDGWQWKPSPADQLSAAMGSVQDTLAVCLGRRVPVIPVLAFPDMKADEDIEALARADGVKVVWGHRPAGGPPGRPGGGLRPDGRAHGGWGGDRGRGSHVRGGSRPSPLVDIQRGALVASGIGGLSPGDRTLPVSLGLRILDLGSTSDQPRIEHGRPPVFH